MINPDQVKTYKISVIVTETTHAGSQAQEKTNHSVFTEGNVNQNP